MNSKEIASKYNIEPEKLDSFILGSDLSFTNSMFKGLEVKDDPEVVMQKYNEFLEDKKRQEAEKQAAEQAEQERLKNVAEEQRRIAAEIERADKEARDVIVTTGDLKADYEIIGPVYFQVSNKGLFGSSLSKLKSKYFDEILEMKMNGTMSLGRADWGFLYGEWSAGQNEFEQAFYIATEELKRRAKILGGDAVIAMRQDIDLDTNAFQFFYLQMYGTAVKFK